MPYPLAHMDIPYEHPNFNGAQSLLSHKAAEVFPTTDVFSPDGTNIGQVQWEPGDGGQWTARIQISDPAMFAVRVFHGGDLKYDSNT